MVRSPAMDPFRNDAILVDRELEQLVAVSAERVLAREPCRRVVLVEELDADGELVEDALDVAAVAVGAKQFRRSEQQVDGVDAALDRPREVL